jgi:hypothetical protein
MTGEPQRLEPEKPASMLKKIIAFTLIAGVLFVGVAAWWMFSGSGKSLGVDILAPARLQSGVPVEIAVAMSNDSGSDLKDAQVSLSLPDGLIFVGLPGRRTVENRSVGSLKGDALTKATFSVMATGAVNTVLTIKASVSYVPGALSSRFEKTITKELVVGEPGVELSISPPTKVFGSEEFKAEITYRNTSEQAFTGTQIQLTYPAGFTFTRASREATDETNRTWSIDSLRPGDTGSLSISGYLVGQDNENFEFKVAAVAPIGESNYEIAKQSAVVALQPSPLSIQIETLPDAQAVFSPGDTVRYRLNYVNNTAIGLRDVIIRARIVGEMFDLRTLKSTGALRASDNTIVWNASRIPGLANMLPRDSGSLEFSLQLKPTYPISRLSSKNYSLSVYAEIESPTVPANVAATKTLGVAQRTNKVRGELLFSSLGYYRDASSGIVNNGVFPPRVGAPTQFTIHWVLKNTSTDVENIRARAFLGPNVRYTGLFKTTIASTTIAYNERTQEMTWEIGKLAATRGILSDAPTLVFQVELTPGATQVQTTPEIVQMAEITYTDLFTGEPRRGSAKEITTRLPDDPTVFGGDRSIRE